MIQPPTRPHRLAIGSILVLTFILSACTTPATSTPTGASAPAVTSPPAPAASQNLGKITVGLAVAKTFEFLPAYAAEEMGVWKRRGLDVEITTFAGDARLMQAFAAGGADVGLTAISGLVSAAEKGGLDARMVAAISNSVQLMGLAVHPSIVSTADLRGKTLGATSPNAITDVLIKYLSKQLTGDPEQGIKRAHLGAYENQVAALKTGQTQGFVWTLDVVFLAEKQGVGKYLLSFGDEFPDYTFETVVASKHLIDQRPEALRAFLEGFYEALARIKTDKDYTVDLFERKMEVPKDVGARVWEVDAKALVEDGAVSEKALQTALQSLVEAGVISQAPPRDRWLDARFVPVRGRS